jgi:CRP/FNR family transcriptional regulator, cyclic AMP receptor protein
MTTSVANQLYWSNADVARMLISNNALANVENRDAMALAKRMRLCRVASNKVLFRAGDTNTDFMALVLEGEAVVESLDTGAGEAVVLHVLVAGQMVGEMSVVANAPRSACVTASTDMVVAVLDQSAFALLIKQEPDVACGFLSALLHSTSDRLRESNRKLLTLTKINQSLFEELDASQQNKSELSAMFVPASNFKTVQTRDERRSTSNSPHPITKRAPKLGRFQAAKA